MDNIRRTLVVLALVCGSHAGAASDTADRPGSGSLEVLRATPSGDDTGGERQVVFTFDRAVVPLGDMSRTAAEIDVKVEPALACEWRWIDTTSLACQLGTETELKPATRYRFTIGRGLKAEDGMGLAKPYVHEFGTARPRVERYIPFTEWRSPGMPVVRVAFGYPVVTETARKHLFFKVDGARVATVFERADTDRPRDPAAPIVPEEPPSTAAVLLVRPAQDVGPDRKIELWVEPGIATPLGPELSDESRALVGTWTLPLPRFLGVTCVWEDSNEYRGRLIAADGSTGADVRCDPMRQVALVFSSPMLADEVKQKLKFAPDLAGGRKDFDPWAPEEEVYEEYDHYEPAARGPHERGRLYYVSIPILIRADEEHRISAPGGTVADGFGRPIAEAIDFRFRTAPRPPRLVFDDRIAALEKSSDSDLPLVVTNLEAVEVSFRTLTMELPQQVAPTGTPEPRRLTLSPTQTKRIPMPKLKDISFYTPMGVRELLGGRSGAIIGEVASDPRTGVQGGWEGHGKFFAQISPWQVHFKFGHFNSLVWVTDMKTGAAVANARVRVMRDDRYIPGDGPVLAEVVTDKDGIATLPGSETLDPERKETWGWQRGDDKLVLYVDRGADLAIVPLDPTFATREYFSGVWPSTRNRGGHTLAWGTTAQGVYRPGDTVQFKLYVRGQDNQTLVAPPRTGYSLAVSDPTDATVFELKSLTLNEFGAYDGEFKVPATGAVGWYSFKLRLDADKRDWWPMRVLVTDFTPAPFRVTNETAGDLFGPGDTIATSTHARLHAGGPYGKAEARVTVMLQPTALPITDTVARSFQFDTYRSNASDEEGHDDDEGGYRARGGVVQLFQGEGSLDEAGDLNLPAPLPENPVVYGRLTVESAVRDDRGKYMASVASAGWHGRDRYIGMRTSRWTYKAGEPAEVEWLVVDARGQRVAGDEAKIGVEQLITTGARVKGAGNAYLMHYTHRWEPVTRCDQAATVEPRKCVFTPAKAGVYRVQAEVRDAQGRPHSGERRLWVTGPDAVLWEDDNTGTVRLIPERSEYKVGDKARILVQNPLPGARALVTVERYGVIKRWTQTLNGSTPVIEFPIERDFVPGAFVSVLIASPRVDKPLEAGQVDLGKPTLRMGYIKLEVDEAAKRLAVKVAPEKAEYRPQDEVSVKLDAGPGGKGVGAPLEYAVIVLDEAVFDLIQGGADYHDPHHGIWALDGLDMRNFNLLSTLVGRRKYEKKGANPGGDGGLDFTPRSDFKFVAYWNPSLRTGPDGKASFKFKVPDNLTGWRVIAMAVDAGERLGVGVGGFKVNRPTEVRPVMPNQLTAGDRFDAGFSVMNRTAGERTLSVTMTVAGPLAPGSATTLERKLTLAPWARSTVTMPVVTQGSGALAFTVAARDAIDKDGLRHALTVNPVRASESVADWGTTFVPRTTIKLKLPSEMRPDVGTIGVTVSPTVLANLDGAFRYLRDYPYWCWEQRLSKGIAAMHFTRLKPWLGPQLEWAEAGTLTRRMLDDAATFQAPDGGMTYWLPRSEYVSPYLSVYTLRAFGWSARNGTEPPAEVERKLQGYVQNLLRRDAVPSFYDGGMTATVRAVGLAALADRGKLDKAELERFRPHLTRMSLFGKASFLEAAVKAKGSAAVQKEAAQQILANTIQSAGKVSFNERLNDSYRQLLATPLRDQCAVLSAFAAYGETKDGAALVGDLPFKLVRTISAARGVRDRWENTQENAFCMAALVDYARVYEKADPVFTVEALLDLESLGKQSFATFRDPPKVLQRAIRADDVGAARSLTLVHEGEGRMYYATRISYAPTGADAGAVNAGFEVKREYSVQRDGQWVLLSDPMRIARGELVRVDLFVSVPTARHMVVVDDPVPGGLEPVNRDLATASGVDAAAGEFKAAGGSWWYQYGDWDEFGISNWSFYHRELRHDSARFYADYLPAGRYHLSYSAQAIATGAFSVMPGRAEEMYDPDVFGRVPPAQLEVVDE